jgi:hypothetical protein
MPYEELFRERGEARAVAVASVIAGVVTFEVPEAATEFEVSKQWRAA